MVFNNCELRFQHWFNRYLKHYFYHMKDKLLNWSLLLLLAVIWGSSFILMKKGMYNDLGKPVFSSVQVGALRMLIAGSVMLPFGIRYLLKLKSINDLLFLSIVGFCGNFFSCIFIYLCRDGDLFRTCRNIKQLHSAFYDYPGHTCISNAFFDGSTSRCFYR